ncbi:MAG: 50S ribosomal protein L29 [Bacteroidota bacterium]
MKTAVIKEMSLDEIRERVEGEENMLAKLKLNHAISQLENPMKIKYARKTVARLLTEIRIREIQGSQT